MIKIKHNVEECMLRVSYTHFFLGVQNVVAAEDVQNVAAAEAGLGVENTLGHLHDKNKAH